MPARTVADRGLDAGVAPGTTFTNFTNDRIIYAPTDLVWVLGRVLVLNDSDVATAYNYSKSYAIASYNPARELLSF